ncbi:MAG: TOBE domain-containing protein [Candidatus Eiseniibacteriota bacterium]
MASWAVAGAALAQDPRVEAAKKEGKVAAGGLTPGAGVALSHRPHQIELVEPPGGGAVVGGVNALRGTIRRASFLGDSVDYQIEVAESDLVLRVAASTAWRLRPGDAVGLRVDPTACVPLADGAA